MVRSEIVKTGWKKRARRDIPDEGFLAVLDQEKEAKAHWSEQDRKEAKEEGW